MTRLRPTTVRARLTLWYTLLLSLPLAAFAMVSYFLLANTLRSRTDGFISDALSVFSRELVSERRIRPTLVDAIQATVHEVRFQNLDIVVFDEAGAVVAMSAPVSRKEASAGGIPDSIELIGGLNALAGTPRPSTLERPGGAYRVLLQPVQVGDRTFRLAGLYPLLEVDATLDRIRDLYLVAIPLLIAAAAIGGWFLAKRSLAPVSSMAAGVRWLSYLMPLTYFAEIARAVMVRGAGLSAVWPQLALLAALGAVVVTLATLRFQRDLAPAPPRGRAGIHGRADGYGGDAAAASGATS